jgi:hypothetical protein
MLACRDIYICIAYAFGVSTAMEKTNVAAGIAQVFVMISEWLEGAGQQGTCTIMAAAAAACCTQVLLW